MKNKKSRSVIRRLRTAKLLNNSTHRISRKPYVSRILPASEAQPKYAAVRARVATFFAQPLVVINNIHRERYIRRLCRARRRVHTAARPLIPPTRRRRRIL